MNKFRLLSAIVILSFLTSSLNAQNNVGIGTNTPDPSAVLDVSATDKGMLVPRLTTAQRLAIASPANGLIVFDTDVDCFHFYSSNSGTWENLCTGGGSGLACWDANGDGIQDPAEDVNSDGNWDYLDCIGATGPAGANGADGTDGLACWDVNGDGVQDPAEDVNSDGNWDYLDCVGATGPAGANGADGTDGLACWDTNGNGIQDPAEDTNSDGNWDASDCGGTGQDGLSCWDTNGDGIADPAEDVNSDGSWDYLDCIGATGPAGSAGANGADGSDGSDGIACWDANGDGVQDPAEDVNSDGNWDYLDCQGPEWKITGVAINAIGTVSITTDEPATYTSTEGAWRTTGNASTVVGTNFIGTTDAVDFASFTNNTERMRITSSGQVSVNNATPAAGDVFSVTEQAAGDYGVSSYVTTGVGVFGLSTSGDGLLGISTAGGFGVYGYTDGGVSSIFGLSTGTTDAVRGHVTAAASNIWFPVWGVHEGADGIGVVGTGNAVTTSIFPTEGAGGVFNGQYWGVYGYAQGATNATVTSAGGYFRDSVNVANETYAYVAAFDGGTEYKILGPGAVSTIVDGNNGSNDKRIMYAPEAPEVLFEDYGQGQLTNGHVKIMLDEIFAKNVTINDKHPLRVFIQLEGDCQGTYVYNKTSNSFEVKELNGGNSNVKFTYHVVANRADSYTNGELRSKYEDIRFPSAPDKAASRTKQVKTISTPNIKQSNKK